MKKRILFFTMMCLLGLLSLNAQETTFSYDFNDGSLTGWRTFKSTSAYAVGWQISPTIPLANYQQYYQGTDNSNCIVSVSYDLYYSDTYRPDSYIVTNGTYQITATSKLSWNAKTPYSSAGEYYEVVISETGADDSFVYVWSETLTNVSALQQKEVNLAELASDKVGKEVYIGFRHYRATSNSSASHICIDDVVLTGEDSGGGETPTPDPTPEPEDPTLDLTKQYRVELVSNTSNTNSNIGVGQCLTIKDYTAHTAGPVGGVALGDYTGSNAQIFTLEDAGNNTYYFRSAGGYYIYCQSWNVDAYSFTTKTALGMTDLGNGTFYLMNGANHFKVEYIPDHSGNYPFCDATAASTTWRLVAVEESAPEVPEVPKNVAATANGTTITLTWAAVADATSYNVYSGSNTVATALTGTTYTTGELAAGEYCYTVTAVNATGESVVSTEVCATIEAAGDDETGNVVEIGSGDSVDNTMPARPVSNYSATQQIYTASEINHAAGTITKIALRAKNNNGFDYTRKWEVYMANILETSFASASSWVTSNLVKVFDGDVKLPPSDAWFELPLTNNFDYAGNSIVLCVIDKTGAYATGTQFYVFTGGAGSSLTAYGSNPYDVNSLPSVTANYRYSFKNQIQFTFAAETKFNLVVNVTDKENGNALEGATVSVSGAYSGGNLNLNESGSTDANGTYSLADLSAPTDYYTVTVSESGYDTETREVTSVMIDANNNVTLNVELSKSLPAPSNLRTDKDAYAENESIKFSWDAPNSSECTAYRLYRKVNGSWQPVAYVDGADVLEYTIGGLAYGEYEFSVTAIYPAGESKQEKATTTVYVYAEGSIYGYVRNLGGWPLPEVTVTVELIGGNEVYTTTTDNGGQYSIEGMKTGTYRITASKVGYYDGTKTGVTVKKDENTDAETICLEAYDCLDFTVDADVNNNGTGLWADDYVEVGWSGSDASLYKRYNIYRENYLTGEVELISHYTEITNKYYKDDEWSLLEDGEYRYGVSAYTGAERLMFTEDFNKGGAMPEGWTVVAPYRCTWNIVNADGYSHTGYPCESDPNLWSFPKDLYWASADGLQGKYYLVTPKVNVKDALVSFKYAHPDSYGLADDHALEVCWSTSPTGPWTKLWQDNGGYVSNWTDGEVDLIDLPERYVYLAFCANTPQEYANYNGGTYRRADVDNVNINTRVETCVIWSDVLVKETALIFDNNANNGDHYWHTATNWTTGVVPTIDDNVKVIADAIVKEGDAVNANISITETGSLTVNEGATYKAAGSVNIHDNDPAKFVINDGAQVYQSNADVKATFNMNIVNPGSWGADGNHHSQGWQFISSPFVDADFMSYVNPTSGDYDLYKYDGKVDTLEWRNYKLHHDELLCAFSTDAEGWIIRDENANNVSWEYAPLRMGSDGNAGCMSMPVVNEEDDYLISPRRLNIYPESKLRFYVKLQSETDEDFPMMMTEGLDVVYSTGSDYRSAFEVLSTVSNVSSGDWAEVVIDLSSIASTTDDVDAVEAWIGIRYKSTAQMLYNLLIDNIELANVYDKATPFEKTFLQGRGYMASYESAATVSMVGTLYEGNSFTYTLDYNADNRWENFYLLGNPFPYDLQWDEFSHTGIVPGFAVVNSASGAYQYDVDVNSTIKSGDGFLVLTTASNPTLSVNATRSAKSNAADYVNVIANGAAGSDNLIISLAGKENGGFFKLENFNKDIASVYVENYDDMYGIASYDEDVEEVDFSFVANNIGYYTISMIPKGDFASLKLYDRVENVETDMLQNTEYKFFALSADDANSSRFVLRYEKKGVESAGNFAYQSGDDLVVNADGLIQIIDVMGRVLYSAEAQGVNNRINVAGMENATYVIRNIKNNEVRTQKIVIL